jgi:putative DNA primase/helicase
MGPVFKQITGNDTVTGEYKFRDSFSFLPYCRLLFSANHPPQSKDASKAFYDRWIVVPFNRTFRGLRNEIPRNVLDARLAAPRELSGALNKALVALKRLRIAGKFTETESTSTALAQFHAVTDPLAVWLDRNTVSTPTAMVLMSALHTEYNRACSTDGRPPMTSQLFGRALRKLRPDVGEAQRTIGFQKSQRVYLGIGLREQSPGLVDPLDSPDSRDSPLPVCNINPGSLALENEEEQVRLNRVNRVNGAARE